MTAGRRRSLAAMLAAGAAALSGCSGDGVGTLMVDPARYAGYHCNDLVTELGNLAKREQKLRDLINKADDSGAGTVIGAVAYRPDYETTLQQEKLLRRTAAEKNCPLTPTYGSDQTIR
jgi:hypothetical protein